MGRRANALAGPPREEAPAWWSTDEWATPPEEVARFVQEFGPFNLDPCARDVSVAKGEWFYTKAEDGLVQPWFGHVWVNMPYSDPRPWLEKAIAEIEAGRAELVVCCCPADISTGWYHDLIHNHPLCEERPRRGRLKFHGWHGAPIGSPVGGTIYAIYRPRR